MVKEIVVMSDDGRCSSRSWRNGKRVVARRGDSRSRQVEKVSVGGWRTPRRMSSRSLALL